MGDAWCNDGIEERRRKKQIILKVFFHGFWSFVISCNILGRKSVVFESFGYCRLLLEIIALQAFKTAIQLNYHEMMTLFQVMTFLIIHLVSVLIIVIYISAKKNRHQHLKICQMNYFVKWIIISFFLICQVF